jgi:hypothetical protein
MWRTRLNAFIKIVKQYCFRKYQLCLFLLYIFSFFNRAVFRFVKSTIKTVLLEINFSTYAADVFLETRFEFGLPF